MSPPTAGFRTGDLGKLDGDGSFSIFGGSKEHSISGGLNVYPVEVEAVLGAYADAVECAVVGLPDADLGERVTCVVVLRDSSTASAEDARLFVRKRLSGYNSSHSVVVRNAFPRTPLGKVEKVRLHRQLLGCTVSLCCLA